MPPCGIKLPPSVSKGGEIFFLEKQRSANQICLSDRAVAQLGRALEWGSRGREFKSLRPDFRFFAEIDCVCKFGDTIPHMSDSIKELTAEICAFRDARDWAQFHNPKEMAVAIAAEAGELLQHFVWQDGAQSLERVSMRRAEIESEMADVGILLFEMAANCGVDLGGAMQAKMARNEERYSVAKAKGSNKKYNEL